MDRNRLLATKESVPAVGFVAVVLATLVSTVVMFPDHPAPRGALMLPALVLTAGIMFVPVLRALTSSEEMTNAENFIMFGFVFWLLLDLLQGSYDLSEASEEALHSAFLSIGVSAACVWVGLSGRVWTPPKWLVESASRPLDTQTIARLVPICFLLGMLNFAYFVNFDIPLMFSYVGANRWSAPWARGQLGGWSSFIDQMPYFGYVLPSLTALLITRRGLLKFESLLAVFCSVIMLLFLAQGGGRRIIGVTVGAAILVYLQANPGLKLKNILIVGASVVALLFVSQFMLNIRQGGIEGFQQRGSEYDSFHVDDNFLRLAQVIDIVPASHPYIGISQITFTLIRPIPRVFWPNKPVDPGFDLAAATRQKGVSLSTTIIGEWYLAYGWIAVIFGGWFHGRLAKAANSIREIGKAANNPVVYAMAVMVLFAGMRSMLDLVVMSYALVAWWGINRLMSPKVPAIA